jgi:hypothetical protein
MKSFSTATQSNLVRALVAEQTASPPTQRTMYRVVHFASEMFDADAGKWIAGEKLYMIHPALR